ncbi:MULTISPECIES: type IV toxin-antitoxin system AbiEi family antitoxin domain-containing protein [Actinoplanes]|uniref:type IV toxin-antitoxin system AbiEi family antitoxin domain-containing protein n=1 Tax=Actinoplanes TaxID=1865 RepID=UPI001FE17C5B|nr:MULTISPECIES: type IV toxin-antitoxin system AbiEi family antitoxin domain-containing protein [Actinoplanes]
MLEQGRPRFAEYPDLREWPELLKLVVHQHGVISWQQARRHLSEKAVLSRVRTGRWRKVHRAVYLAHTGPVSDRERYWIASLGAGNGRPAPVAGLSALILHGFRPPRAGADEGGPIHTVIPHRLVDRNPPPGVVVHRSRLLRQADVCLTVRPPCTMPDRSLLDAAQWALSDVAATALIAAAFQQRLVSAEQMVSLLRCRGRLIRRAVIAAAVADAGGGSESIYEVEFHRLCKAAGLPAPTRQAVRRDRDGRRRYRDVFFDPWLLQVEIDGSQHMTTGSWYADMRSGNAVAISGVRLLRFPGWKVRHRPEEVVAEVRAALLAAGWKSAAI